MMSNNTGVVSSYSSKNGYGFITDNETGDNVFVHQNDIVMEGFRSLNQGEEVEYDVEESEKGFKALNVILLSKRRARSNDYITQDTFKPKRTHNKIPIDDYAKIKSDLRRLQKSFDRLLLVLSKGEDPVLLEDEINEVKGESKQLAS